MQSNADNCTFRGHSETRCTPTLAMALTSSQLRHRMETDSRFSPQVIDAVLEILNMDKPNSVTTITASTSIITVTKGANKRTVPLTKAFSKCPLATDCQINGRDLVLAEANGRDQWTMMLDSPSIIELLRTYVEMQKEQESGGKPPAVVPSDNSKEKVAPPPSNSQERTDW